MADMEDLQAELTLLRQTQAQQSAEFTRLQARSAQLEQVNAQLRDQNNLLQQQALLNHPVPVAPNPQDQAMAAVLSFVDAQKQAAILTALSSYPCPEFDGSNPRKLHSWIEQARDTLNLVNNLTGTLPKTVAVLWAARGLKKKRLPLVAPTR